MKNTLYPKIIIIALFLGGFTGLMFFLHIASVKETELRYLDQVNVVSGFYKGCSGVVKAQHETFGNKYKLDFMCSGNPYHMYDWFDKKDLKVVPSSK